MIDSVLLRNRQDHCLLHAIHAGDVALVDTPLRLAVMLVPVRCCECSVCTIRTGISILCNSTIATCYKVTQNHVGRSSYKKYSARGFLAGIPRLSCGAASKTLYRLPGACRCSILSVSTPLLLPTSPFALGA